MYRFGGCVLDPHRRELHRDGAAVHLEPQAFDLLVYLIENRDRVVEKVELLDAVWGHTFLSESNLTTRVKEARRAIGDDGSRQEGIANVRGRGYRFIATVDEFDPGRPERRRGELIGREVEMATIVDLLRFSPLITLTGPGGVGKSALARVVAQAAPLCPDGAWVVDLAPLSAGSAVLSTVARGLDLVVDDVRTDDTLRAIARRDALLVVDNCEHVVDEVAELVDRLLAVPGGALRMLATSRVRLGSSAEHVSPVGPLEVDAARELFSARARAVLPSWDLTAVGSQRVDRLVDRLDRLPLTIEMAAARLGSMTLDDVEHAIRSGASLLQLSHRAPAPRHRSLESIVDWSATLLDPTDRAVLEGFSVFAGPVSAADAAAVLRPDDGVQVRSALAALAERSLLVADLRGPTTRYSMLATVRAVAGRRLADHGTDERMRARHAMHITTVLQEIDDQLRTAEEVDGRVRLAGLIDEARAAHQWARQHQPRLASDMSAALFLAAHSSLWFEPADWANALLDDGRGTVGEDQHGALLAAAGAAAHRGQLTDARTVAATVAAAATGRRRAIAVEVLADIALYEGDLAEARRTADELARLGDELDDAHAIAFAAVDGALARTYGGDPDGALVHLADGELPSLSPTDAAWVEYARAEALSTGSDSGASNHYRHAVELGSSVGSRFVVSAALTSLATDLARTGDVAAALTAHADALAAFRRHGNHTHALTAMRNLVGLLGELGNDRGAVVLGAATSSEGLPRSYGAEATLVAGVLDSIRNRVGEVAYDSWCAEGRNLDMDQCLRTAERLVADHRD